MLELLDRARRALHVLRARLGRRAVPAAGASGSPPRATRSPATATGTSSSTSSPKASSGRTCAAARGCSRTSPAAPVRGYRAPSFSITEWAIPILQELGFAYDSSAFPTVAHDRYGSLPGRRGGHAGGGAAARLSRGLRLVPDGGLARPAVGRRRLLPAAALRRLPPRGGPDTPLRPALRLLHPSLGDRPGPAARERLAAGCTSFGITSASAAPRIASDPCSRTSAGGAWRTFSTRSASRADPAPPPGRPAAARRTRAPPR